MNHARVLLVSLILALLVAPVAAQEPDLDARVAQHAQLVADAAARQTALNTAIEARRATATLLLASLGTREADKWTLDTSWWFDNPWRAEMPSGVLENGSREAPQDRDFDRSLPEYLLLLETRGRLDLLNRWKIENEAALAWCTTRSERLRNIRELLQQGLTEQESVRIAAEALRTAAQRANEARTKLLQDLPAGDPRRDALPPEVKLEDAVASGDIPVPMPDVERVLIPAVGAASLFVDKLANTLADQRKLRREQEDLLLERRLLLQADLRRKTQGGERLDPDGVDLGALATLFARYESIGEQLFNLRDLLLVTRQETALVDHADVVLEDENKRLAGPNAPGSATAASVEPYSLVAALYNSWRAGYRTFVKRGTGGGPVDSRLSGLNGERRRTRNSTEQWMRSISGMSRDQEQLISRIQEGLANISGEPAAMLRFFNERARRENDRLERARMSQKSIEAELGATREEQEQLNTRIGELEQRARELADAPENETRTQARARFSAIAAVQAAIENARSRQPVLAARATLMEEARTDTARQIEQHNGFRNLWLVQADEVQNRINNLLVAEQHRHQQELAEDAREKKLERDRLATEQMNSLRNSVLLIVISLAIGFLILRAMKIISLRLEAKLEEVSRRQARVRIQRTRTVFYFAQSMTSIVVVIAVAIVILYAVGVGEDLITWLVGSVGVLALAVSFGAQSLIRDFFTGFFILLENQYVQGDWVKIGDVSGTVENVGLRTTVLRDLDGVRHVIVNGSISVVANMTARYSRAILDLGLSYSDDPEAVIPALEQLCASLTDDPVMKECLMPLIDKPAVMGLQRFEDSAIVYRLNLACRPGMQWEAARRLRRMFFKLAKDKGFTIPFPHRTVYLHAAEEAVARTGEPKPEA